MSEILLETRVYYMPICVTNMHDKQAARQGRLYKPRLLVFLDVSNYAKSETITNIRPRNLPFALWPLW